MSRRDDELVEAYLQYLRGEGDLPSLEALAPDRAAEARDLFALLDAITDMGRELPELDDDPVAHALGLLSPQKQLAAQAGNGHQRPEPIAPVTLHPIDVVAPPARNRRSDPGRKSALRCRSLRRRGLVINSVAAVAAMVVLIGQLAVLRGTTPAGAVTDTPLTSDCAITSPYDSDNAGDRHVLIAAAWAGEEKKRFREVLERFSSKTGIDVSFATEAPAADRDIAGTLQTLRQQGCAPDVALLPQPGLLKKLVEKKNLLPIDDIVGQDLGRNYSPAWQELGKVDGRSYGVWFKAANKSIIWYNVSAFRRAGIETPKDWDDLKDAAGRLLQAGITPFAIGGGGNDGWVLTDWFENVYLATAGGDKYDELARGQVAWTDPSVKRALATLAEIFAEREWLADNMNGREGMDLKGAIASVFADAKDPDAAMVFEGDFVANMVGTSSKVGVDARFFPFPPIGRSERAVVPATSVSAGETGGDIAVLMRDTDAGRRLLRFLATPEAAEPWVQRGGFISPNKKIDLDRDPGVDARRAASELVSAAELRFDLSDLLPTGFADSPASPMWRILQDFLSRPEDIDGTAERLQKEFFRISGKP